MAMAMEGSSWWLDTGRLYARYTVAVAASIPAGVVYAYLAVNKLDRWWAAAALLVIGLGLATAGWRISEYLFAPSARTVGLQPSQSVNVGAYGLGLRVATGTVVASTFVIFCAPLPTRSFTTQANCVGVIEQLDAAATPAPHTTLAQQP
jgi:hypothetical protein